MAKTTSNKEKQSQKALGNSMLKYQRKSEKKQANGFPQKGQLERTSTVGRLQ